MLLGHTSGVPNHTDNPCHKPTNTPLQSIALSAQQKPIFAPGTSWSYSNTNYIILGVIAEKATASTWQKQLESRFFEPLALSDTYVWNGKAVAKTVTGSRLNCGYPGEPDCVKQPGFKIIPETAGADWTVAWSAGAIVSTPTDVARWMRALVSGNVLDAEHRALLTTPTRESVKVLANKPPYGTLRWTGGSLGLLRFEIEGVGWGHSGAINGFVSNVAHMTGSGQTVSVRSNFENTNSRVALGQLSHNLLRFARWADVRRTGP